MLNFFVFFTFEISERYFFAFSQETIQWTLWEGTVNAWNSLATSTSVSTRCSLNEVVGLLIEIH